MVDTNIKSTIADLKKEILEKLKILKERVRHLETAVNDPEIETRGIGSGWVTNVEAPLQSISFRVAQIDALASVRVYPKKRKKRTQKKAN